MIPQTIQSVLDADRQQPQVEGTTFWFRWFVRLVAVITGIVAMICGVIGALSIYPSCIASGIILIALGFAMIMFEVPICCQFVEFTRPVANFSEKRPPWQKALLYTIPPFIPLILCHSISIVFGFICLIVNGAVQFMLAVGKKATREEMLARASANRGQPLTDDPSVVPPMNDKPFSYSVFNELMPPKK